MESDVRELHDALKCACADDPSLSAVAPGCSAHCHGWGYVIQADNGLFHYRSARSIYQDESALPKMEGHIRAIFHGRYASKPELAGPIFSHPFVATDDIRTTYFAHNGGIEAPGLPERKVDSEWALEQIIAMGGIEPALPMLKTHTKSALNLLVLTIDRQKDTPRLAELLPLLQAQRAREDQILQHVRGRHARRTGSGLFHPRTAWSQTQESDKCSTGGF